MRFRDVKLHGRFVAKEEGKFAFKEYVKKKEWYAIESGGSFGRYFKGRDSVFSLGKKISLNRMKNKLSEFPKKHLPFWIRLKICRLDSIQKIRR